MAVIERVLVPVDGSELAEKILEHARRLVQRTETEVLLLRVVPERPLRLDDREAARLHEDRIDAARRYLEQLQHTLEGQGVRVRSVLLVGEPASRILEAAADFRPTLIALSTHGRTGLRRFVRGSVAERVLRESRTPLLLANPFAIAEGPRHPSFSRILLPLDGSDESTEVLPLVRALAQVYGSEVVLVHVLEPEVEMGVGEPSSRTTASPEDVASARALLEHHRSRSLEGVASRAVVLEGAPSAAILDQAEREAADLIALTTHGRSGTTRWIYGSVAEHVIREASCPLLVYRTR